MTENGRKHVSWAVASIFILQFICLPFFGDLFSAGKLFIFFFGMLILAIRFFFKEPELNTSPVILFFMLLLACFLVSSGRALEPWWALLQASIFAGFILFLMLVTHQSARFFIFLERMVDALLFSGVVAAILGLYEHMHYLLLGPTHSMLIPYLLPPNTQARVFGHYGQPNQLALFLTVSLLAFFYRYIHQSPTCSTNFRLASLRFVPFALVSYVFFLTLSRSGFLSQVLVFGFLAWLVVSRRYLAEDPTGRREFYKLMFSIGVVFLLSKMHIYNSTPQLQMVRPLGDTGINPSGRFVFWTSAILIFLDHPWLGIGLDHYKNAMNAYGPLSHKVLGFVPYEAMRGTNWAHNDLLQILCEGGIFAIILTLFLLSLFVLNIYKYFFRKDKRYQPVFLYYHLFLFPFFVHSMFEYPFRSAPLLILFFSLLGGLLSQYPLKTIRFSPRVKRSTQVFLLFGLFLVCSLFYQEIQLGTFKRNFLGGGDIENSLQTFSSLAERPYSSYRVLNGALPVYIREALSKEDDRLAKKILPYYEKLSALEGARWQWYDLARIYLKVGRETDAREAIQRAVDLMPLDNRTNAFLHYLNMLKASRATGRPLDSFWPRGQKVDFNKLELLHD